MKDSFTYWHQRCLSTLQVHILLLTDVKGARTNILHAGRNHQYCFCLLRSQSKGRITNEAQFLIEYKIGNIQTIVFANRFISEIYFLNGRKVVTLILQKTKNGKI